MVGESNPEMGVVNESPSAQTIAFVLEEKDHELEARDVRAEIALQSWSRSNEIVEAQRSCS
jgi:hypothetical protein